MSEDAISSSLNLPPSRTDGCKRFLLSSKFAEMRGDALIAGKRLRHLAHALRLCDAEGVRSALLHSPQFAKFAERAAGTRVGQSLSGGAAMRELGELTLMCAALGGRTWHPTPCRPRLSEFAEAALRRFEELAMGGCRWAPVGAWLESLIRNEGIHPEFARRTLEKASGKGQIVRFTEGSTMQLGFERHALRVLDLDALGEPEVRVVKLWRGDYLIPGKSSVSLRLQAPKKPRPSA